MSRQRRPLWRDNDEKRLVEAWVLDGYSDRTIQLYLYSVRRADEWCRAHGYRLRALNAVQCRELASATPRTWSARLRLRSALSAFWRVSGHRKPPTRAIVVPTKPRMRSRALAEADALRLKTAATARADAKGLAVLLGLFAGLRRMEIAGLRWDDFEDDFTWLNIVGKGEVSASLPVHPELAQALRAMHRPADEWIFPGRYGGPVTYSTIWAWVREVSEQAELHPVKTHVLRHTCLTSANDATGDLRAVQELARHARPDTTAGYTRVNTKRMLHVVLSLNYEQLAKEAASA